VTVGADLRAEAAGMLVAVIFEGRSLKSVLAQALPLWPDPRDRALLEAICFAALRHRRRYEFALSGWMAKPLAARDGSIHALLLAGLAQVDEMRLPAHAAVAATAEAARLLGRHSAVGLVNALLRRALREGLPASDDPAISSSHPDWLVQQLQRDWPQQLDRILIEGNRPAPLWLRANAPAHPRDVVLQAMEGTPATVQLPDFPADAIRIDERLSPTQLPGWSEGAFTIQDGAAQLAVAALAPTAGERVLDACAAPGGKAAQIAAIVTRGELLALDVDATRLKKIDETLQRMRLASPHVHTAVADAADTQTWWDGKPFDAILIDAPCSATGIIRRQPDIKWHRRSEDIPALVTQQSRLLDALWPLLAPGGRLLYATCSLLKDENERQIDGFLARTPDMRAMPLDARYGIASGAGRQRFPGDDGMDGFFYALMARKV